MGDSEDKAKDYVSAGEFKKLKEKFLEHQIEHRIKNRDYDIKHEQTLEAISQLTSSTQDVVDAWKVASGLQRFVKWLSGFAVVVGAAIAFFSKHWPHIIG